MEYPGTCPNGGMVFSRMCAVGFPGNKLGVGVMPGIRVGTRSSRGTVEVGAHARADVLCP